MADGMSQPVPGAAVVCLYRDRVLLVQRDREPNRGRWSFPGGRIEPGQLAVHGRPARLRGFKFDFGADGGIGPGQIVQPFPKRLVIQHGAAA